MTTQEDEMTTEDKTKTKGTTYADLTPRPEACDAEWLERWTDAVALYSSAMQTASERAMRLHDLALSVGDGAAAVSWRYQSDRLRDDGEFYALRAAWHRVDAKFQRQREAELAALRARVAELEGGR